MCISVWKGTEQRPIYATSFLYVILGFGHFMLFQSSTNLKCFFIFYVISFKQLQSFILHLVESMHMHTQKSSGKFFCFNRLFSCLKVQYWEFKVNLLWCTYLLFFNVFLLYLGGEIFKMIFKFWTVFLLSSP